MKYVELEQQLEFYDLDKLADKLKHYTEAIERYAYIKHDQDSKAVHFHCFIEFKSKGYTLDRLAQMFEIDTQYIQKPKTKGVNGFNNCLLYATHRTPEAQAQGKHVYEFDEVVANFDYKKEVERIEEEIANVKNRKSRIEQIIDDYAHFKMTYKQLTSALDFKDFNEYKRRIDNAKIYRDIKAKGEQRNMKVIYITGGAGSGKTTLAKFFAINNGFDYFVSGSGDDPLDGYDNEECIILDDLRGDTFKKSQFFKLTDNNTGSSVKSRYFNKAINHCRLMIITSVLEPSKMYDWDEQSDNEPAKQFVRRLGGEFLEVVGDKILEWTMYDIDCAKLECKTFPYFTMKDVFALMGIVNRNSGLAEVFMQTSKNVREKLENVLKDNGEELPF